MFRNTTGAIRPTLKKLGFSNYSEYLSSDHWKNLRKRFYESKECTRDDFGFPRCCACGITGVTLDLHHKSYDMLGNEPLDHLCLLCSSCHGAVHSMGGNVWYATEQLIEEKSDRHSFMRKLIQLIADHFYNVPALKTGIRNLLDNK